MTDLPLLEICRLRVAQMMGARAELAGADPVLLSNLERWRSSPAFSAKEKAALAFAEQYHLDHHALTDDQRRELETFLTRRQLVNFVWALHVADAHARMMALLDVAPAPAGGAAAALRSDAKEGSSRSGAEPPDPAADADAAMWALLDPSFAAAYSALGKAVVRQKLIDDETSEAIRLHNADHQGCQY
jgi:hypothetical protein